MEGKIGMQIRRFFKGLIFAAFLMAELCCSKRSGNAEVIEKTFLVHSARADQAILQVRTGLGLACRIGNETGPSSFLVSDIGKRTVPILDEREKAGIDRLKRFVHPSTLRFVKIGGSILVFDWIKEDDLCDPDATPVFVLNGTCNEYLQASNQYAIVAAPSCDVPSRPWMPADRGQGATSWSKYNNH